MIPYIADQTERLSIPMGHPIPHSARQKTNCLQSRSRSRFTRRRLSHTSHRPIYSTTNFPRRRHSSDFQPEACQKELLVLDRLTLALPRHPKAVRRIDAHNRPQGLTGAKYPAPPLTTNHRPPPLSDSHPHIPHITVQTNHIQPLCDSPPQTPSPKKAK